MKGSPFYGRLYIALQRLRGELIVEELDQLGRLESAPATELREWQEVHFARVVEAARSTAWYGPDLRTLAAGKSFGLCDLALLPILTKAELRAHAEELRPPGAPGPVNAFETTGSTGVPLRLVRDRAASAAGRAAQLRGRGWYGVRIGTQEVRFGGLSIERMGKLRAQVIDGLMHRIRFSPFDVSPSEMARWLKCIRRVRPGLLYGYPSVLYRLACFVGERTARVSVPLVSTSSEPLFPFRRAKIAEAFGCLVADEYGAAETSIIGFECPQGSMHLAAENHWIEVVDSAGRLLPDGEIGEFVITDLRNVAMPLLRYRIGDVGRRVPGPCACGRTLPRIEIREGTRFGELPLPSGRVLNAVVFHFLAEPVLSKSEGRILDLRVVHRDGGLVIELVLGPGEDIRIAGLLVDLVRREVRDELRVEALSVPTIDRAGSDKFRIFFDEAAGRD